METIDDILEELRSGEYAPLADRIEAAHKREADSIRHAMVILAGIEMEDSANPPRLWTALEDAYDALSDALGTDGDTAADVEEAKASGRHFVVRALGNAAKMREALEAVYECVKDGVLTIRESAFEKVVAALSRRRATATY